MQQVEQKNWHMIEADEVVRQLKTSQEMGLTDAEVQLRLAEYGTNELIERGGRSPLAILWEQLTNPLVLLLILAALISAFLGKFDSVIAILAIVILNSILGVVQEYRAEQAMAALKKMAAPLVRVRRGGKTLDIQSRDLVPGDVILLEAGSVVPADSRLFESANLSVAEAALTGESQPVEKAIRALEEADAPIGDRHNMVYMGTAVTYGRGNAIVVETGMKTQLGRIAELIQAVDSEATPLQQRMNELGKVLLVVALVVMALAFLVGLTTGHPLQEVLLNAVAIAVAVVPEGLPAVVTIALALGAQRMLKRKALIRKLPAVETLGSVTTICSDKTGTLTKNEMTVTVIDVVGKTERLVDVVSRGGMSALISRKAIETNDVAQALLLTGSALCNDVVVEVEEQPHPPTPSAISQGFPLVAGIPASHPNSERGRKSEATDVDVGAHSHAPLQNSNQNVQRKLKAIGDPTEGALVIAAAEYGMFKPALDEMFPRVGEVPFSSERKRMTTIHRLNPNAKPHEGAEGAKYLLDLLAELQREYIGITKGAVDSLLDVCDRAWVNGKIVPLDAAWRAKIEETNNNLAQDGLRVLGMALHRWEALPTDWKPETVEKGLVFIGMMGIIDPPRPEVKEAVRIARRAGIRPVMITGDHPLTAFNIAKQLDIAGNNDHVLTGHELSKMSQLELEGVVENVAVYARVSPEHKLNIVQALQTRGHIAAMTGDGVNDAPALKRADIGVAMGITGTAVSKEASDMVIVDDNFATIVNAIEEGRTIYDNVRRFIKYLLASNTGELVVLVCTQLIAGMTLPLTTLQILWMNLITDGIPALALGVEVSEKGSMQRAPYAPNESIFGRGMVRHILLVGTALGGTGLALGYWAWSNDMAASNGSPAWNTMVFMFLTIAQMGHALGLRSHRESLFSMNIFGNRFLILAVVLTLALQLVAIYLPFFNTLFNTNPLTLGQLALCLVLSTVVFWVVEGEKWLIRRGVLK